MDHPRIDWLAGKPREAIAEYLLWRGAIEIADVSGNPSRLVGLFRSNHYPGPEARALIADYLERHRKGRRGRPPTPAYRMTKAEADLHQAEAAYRYFKKKRKSHDEALVLALQTDINGDTDEMIEPTEQKIEALDAFVKGRRGSSQRMKKRRGVRP